MRPSCYTCKFTSINRTGDITLGDYWGVEKYFPNFYDPKGVSLMFLNTEKGEQMVNKVECMFKSIDVSPEECLQPVLVKPSDKPEWRDEFWTKYLSFGFKEVAYKYWGVLFQNKVALKINRFFRKRIFK